MVDHLFVSGTLKPGESNVRELDGMDGCCRIFCQLRR